MFDDFDDDFDDDLINNTISDTIVNNFRLCDLLCSKDDCRFGTLFIKGTRYDIDKNTLCEIINIGEEINIKNIKSVVKQFQEEKPDYNLIGFCLGKVGTFKQL